MAVDAVEISLKVGTPMAGVAPAVFVARTESIVIENGADAERYAIEALRVVDRMCQEVRAEALRQVKVTMENVKQIEAQQKRAGVVPGG